MKNKFTLIYSILAFIVILLAVAWFVLSLGTAVRDGTEEAQRSFTWLSRETVSSSLEKGFLSELFFEDIASLCKKSRLLSALMIETPAGAVFVWPDNSPYITIGLDGKPAVVSTDVFRKVFGAALDIGDSAAGSVRMTAVISVLQPGAIFSASRNSFMLTLAVLLVTFIVIIVYQPEGSKTTVSAFGKGFSKATKTGGLSAADTEFSLDSEYSGEEAYGQKTQSEPAAAPENWTVSETESAGEFEDITVETALRDGTQPSVAFERRERNAEMPIDVSVVHQEAEQESPMPEQAGPTAAEIRPEGLYSPVTGIGWEQYLRERLDAELVRAASSEQDLALIIVRVSGLLHTDLLARKIASMLLEIFSFRDMLFEFGSDGFAGILQNVNLDLAMKNAEKLFARIDEALIELSSDSRIAIGITTRTARLLPAERMIQEAFIAAKKAQDEPNLPIVAFRANPEKYRAFVAENGMET